MNRIIRGRDFVVVGLQCWDTDMGSTSKYTAIELSKKNRVLFVNPPLDRKRILCERTSPLVHRRIKALKGLEPDLVQVSPTLWVLYPRVVLESINWIPWQPIFDLMNKMNNKRYAAKIKEVIARIGFSDVVLFNDNSMITDFYLKELLQPATFIYLWRDAVTEAPYHKRHGARLEPAIFAKADFVVTNSDYFRDFAKRFNKNCYMIGQGCDVTRYSDPGGALAIPADITNISRPIIGYTGFLTMLRLDPEILGFIAEKKPEWSIVLIGPEDKKFRKSRLHRIKNVYFLGRKSPEELPGYVKAFDVAINPQAINKITNFNYPLKIDEYMAMGKPVVATKTIFMDYFKNDVHLATTYAEWVELISKALSENNDELIAKRIKIAGQHTWADFVDKICALCGEVSM